MTVGYSKKFKRQYKKLPKSIQDKFNERLIIFLNNQRNPSLGVHRLHGKLKNLYSVKITGDIRAVFDEIDSDVIEFVAIGSHSELYT